jgi:hypothetical protein
MAPMSADFGKLRLELSKTGFAVGFTSGTEEQDPRFALGMLFLFQPAALMSLNHNLSFRQTSCRCIVERSEMCHIQRRRQRSMECDQDARTGAPLHERLWPSSLESWVRAAGPLHIDPIAFAEAAQQHLFFSVRPNNQ